jgi:hypothetical protein
MKRLSIILFLIIAKICFSQSELFQDELVIDLINFDNTEVIATATRVINHGGKWYPQNHPFHYSLVSGDDYDVVTSVNRDPESGNIVGRIIFDTEGDQNPDKTLSLSIYRITFNGNKTSSFYVNDICIYGRDVELTFDYENDLLYYGNANSFTSRVYPNDIILLIGNYSNVETLEDYWDNALFCVTPAGYSPKVLFGPNPDISNPTKYKIYRAKGDPALQQLTYTWVGETPADSFSFNDNAIITDYGNAISYYVTAVNSNGESSPTNYVQVIGRENWSTGLSMTTQGSNPRLVWVPYDGFTPAGYKIYRSINTSGGGPGTFGLAATITGQGTVWTDYDLAIGSPWKVYYKIKAYKNSPYQESDFTNTVDIGASGFWKQNNEEKVYSYGIAQNYPNPFNPMTNLTYSVADAGLTQIKVYDLLGRELSELVNEYRERGTYSVIFNAGNLPSGVYIYTIRVNDFQQSKKMTLLK